MSELDNITPAFDPALATRLAGLGVIAVLQVERAEDGPPLARALLEGGVEAMELTLRTECAIDAVRAIRAATPDMLAGVGTVLTPGQVREVVDAGGAFAVSPGFNPEVVRAARAAGLSFAPGVATPSDIEGAMALGCRLLKFFPAEPIGGLAYLKSMAAPYMHLGLQFVPLGGVNAANLRDYLESPLVAAVGGSWLAPRDLVRNGAWDAIRERAREAVALVRGVRMA